MTLVKTFNFKSSGKDLSRAKKELKNLSKNKEKLPIGFRLPLDINSDGTGLFKMNIELLEQLETNFKTLILTKPGEKLGFPNFGVDLSDIIHGLGDENIDQIAMDRIKDSVEIYMPFIQLKSFSSNYENSSRDTPVLNIYIVYQINNSAENTIHLRLDLSNWGYYGRH